MPPTPTEGTSSVTNDCRGCIRQRHWGPCYWLQHPPSSHQGHLSQCQLSVLPMSQKPASMSSITSCRCWYRGHQCLQYGTISACWWSCWCQFCWLLLFIISPKCVMITALLLMPFLLKAWFTGAGPGASQCARSWYLFRITLPPWHLSIVTWIKYMCALTTCSEQRKSLLRPWIPPWKRPSLDQACHPSRYACTGQMNTIPFQLRSVPHSCSRRAGRFPVCVREQERFILCFRNSS